MARGHGDENTASLSLTGILDPLGKDGEVGGVGPFSVAIEGGEIGWIVWDFGLALCREDGVDLASDF